jgi:anti-sigma B factor antagonist
MAFEVIKDSDRSVFRLAGELDLATAPYLVREVSAAARSNGDIYLDLEGLKFMDASGLHALVAICRDVRDGSRVILRSPKGEVARFLELVGTDGIPNLVVDGSHSTSRQLAQAE